MARSDSLDVSLPHAIQFPSGFFPLDLQWTLPWRMDWCLPERYGGNEIHASQPEKDIEKDTVVEYVLQYNVSVI